MGIDRVPVLLAVRVLFRSRLMPHTCEECGEEFGTLSGLRLHDCPEEAKKREWDRELAEHRQRIRTLERAENAATRRAASSELIAAIEQAENSDHTAVYQLLAHYERYLTAEWGTDADDNYDGFQRVFYDPAVSALDDAVVAEGWSFLLDVLDAYWPSVTLDFTSYPDHEVAGLEETDKYEAFPHISHVLTTVTGKQLVRTRRTAGVDAIPPQALEYQLFFHRHPGDSGGWIRSMSYGWGIGHPEHSVAAHLHTLVDGEYEIWASSAIEHAFHADQEAAATLLESVFADGLVSDPGLMLRGLASIARDSYPDQRDTGTGRRSIPSWPRTGSTGTIPFDSDFGRSSRKPILRMICLPIGRSPISESDIDSKKQ